MREDCLEIAHEAPMHPAQQDALLIGVIADAGEIGLEGAIRAFDERMLKRMRKGECLEINILVDLECGYLPVLKVFATLVASSFETVNDSITDSTER